jgi:hypothetical protein
MLGKMRVAGRYEVEIIGACFDQNSVLPIGPHDLTSAPRFSKQFLDCFGRNRLRSHHRFVCFQLWFVDKLDPENMPGVCIQSLSK